MRPYWIDKQLNGSVKVYTDYEVGWKNPRIRNTALKVWADSKKQALNAYEQMPSK